MSVGFFCNYEEVQYLRENTEIRLALIQVLHLRTTTGTRVSVEGLKDECL